MVGLVQVLEGEERGENHDLQAFQVVDVETGEVRYAVTTWRGKAVDVACAYRLML